MIELPETQEFMGVRDNLLNTFSEALLPVGMLDRYQLDGVIAAWWYESQYDLKTALSQGFGGLVESWVATVRDAVESDDGRKNGRIDPFEHPVVTHLLTGFLDNLNELESRQLEIQGLLDAAKEADEDAEADDVEDSDNGVPSESDLKELRKEQREIRKRLKASESLMLDRLVQRSKEMSPEEQLRLVLDALESAVVEELDQDLVAQQRALISVAETWWDKYRVSLAEIEEDRDCASTELSTYMRELKYVTVVGGAN